MTLRSFLNRGALCGLLLCFCSAAAAADPEALAKHDALVALAQEEGDEFEAALAEGEAEGWPSEWLLEARIARALKLGDFGALLEMAPAIEAVGDDFRFGFDRGFISKRQLEGFGDTLRCVVAYQNQDWEAFEALAVSSFAKAPDFNQAFGLGELLARHRFMEARELAAASLTVPMNMQLASVEGETRSIREWVGENKAILVDFWASWCGPCIQLMPSLREKADELSKQGIFVAGVNTDEQGQQEKAVKVRERHSMAEVPWLLDADGGGLSGFLMVDSIPRMVLIDPEGKILFNGHPLDRELSTALAALGVDLTAK